jgi:hypothetical protein
MNWQGKLERSSSWHIRGRPQSPAVRLDDRAANRQDEAIDTVGGRRVGCGKHGKEGSPVAAGGVDS